MNQATAESLLAEIDPHKRLHDVQRRLFIEAVGPYGTGQVKNAVDRVFLERHTFDLPTFHQALSAVAHAEQGGGPRPWHLDDCPNCNGTGWEYVEPLHKNGISYSQVVRCTSGPRITANEYARWKAAQ